ncbi:DUF885 domain-containing protein [Halobacteriovorax sp. CON-3]|uniref:DUF885 domain-containing protein n=1 Tax=Halobacteriovorax sp. CON-3 TaxID=3157710 RepID=UPI003719C6E2
MQKFTYLIFLSLLIITSCFSQKEEDWGVTSDKLAEEFTFALSDLNPEIGSSFGYEQYDKLGTNPRMELDEAYDKLFIQWIEKLEKLEEKTELGNLKVDYEILLSVIKRMKNRVDTSRRLGVIGASNVSESIYQSLFGLINPQSPKHRKEAGVDRFKYYMSEKGKKSYVMGMLSEEKRYLALYKDKIYPFIGEVTKNLENSPAYVAGVKQLLESSGRTDWQKEYELFQKQVLEYDAFIRSEILPYARQNPNLPKELYQIALGDAGVDIGADELIKIGKKDFDELYKEYQKLASQIAKKNNLKKEDPLSVITFLKKKQVTKLDDVQRLYERAADKLEKIIAENDLVSLPKQKLVIRMAGDAESRAQPVPHLNPPPLIGNDGSIKPEFVVPTSSTGSLPFDDFSYESAATILTAHEGRPGHDLQFSRMLEEKTSLIRARYAMNSVNVEGWALYAEDLVYDYLTLEEKFAGLEMRLWRIARYFLDPSVQLGMASAEDVVEVFHNKLGVSKEMSMLEFQRYAYRSPGQATAYYHGLKKIRGLKASIEKDYGRIKLKCFNDTLLSFGLMPHDLILLFKDKFKSCKI